MSLRTRWYSIHCNYSPSKCFGHQVWTHSAILFPKIGSQRMVAWSIVRAQLCPFLCRKKKSLQNLDESIGCKPPISGRWNRLWQKLRTQRTTRWCRELPFSTRWKKLSGRVDHPQVWRKHLKPNCPRLLEALNRCWDQFWEGQIRLHILRGMFLRDDNPDLMVNCMEVQ